MNSEFQYMVLGILLALAACAFIAGVAWRSEERARERYRSRQEEIKAWGNLHSLPLTPVRTHWQPMPVQAFTERHSPNVKLTPEQRVCVDEAMRQEVSAWSQLEDMERCARKTPIVFDDIAEVCHACSGRGCDLCGGAGELR